MLVLRLCFDEGFLVPSAVIFLSFWAEVHYNSIYFQGGNYCFFVMLIFCRAKGMS
jgi:hypothetical protein